MAERKKKGKRIFSSKLTRRTHTKSRTGCLSCKQRRIKCSEDTPTCQNCHTKALSCVYPCRIIPQDPSAANKPATSRNQLSKIPWSFTRCDLQAFHHFLHYGSPALPLGNRLIWVEDVPRIAHQHDYLMQGILALGASHLWRSNSNDVFRRQSLQHRCRAIAGLKTVLANEENWKSQAKVDAMLATCYVLTSQAAHIPDGIQDYLTLVNGCKLITERVRDAGFATSFDVSMDRPFRTFGSELQSILAEDIDEDLIQEGIEALNKLEDLVTLPWEKKFLTAMKAILSAFQDGAYQGYLMDIAGYGMWYHLTGEHLKSFYGNDSIPSKVMIGHLLAVMCLLRILIPFQRWPRNVLYQPPGQILSEATEWITAIYQDLPTHLQTYLDWPILIISRLPKSVTKCINPKPVGLPPCSKEQTLQQMGTCVHIVMWDVLRLCAELTAWFEDLLATIIYEHKQTDGIEEAGFSVESCAETTLLEILKMSPAETGDFGKQYPLLEQTSFFLCAPEEFEVHSD